MDLLNQYQQGTNIDQKGLANDPSRLLRTRFGEHCCERAGASARMLVRGANGFFAPAS
jgi:hypothetical protein